MIQLLPVAVVLLGGGTWYAVAKREKDSGMTAERKLIFDGLINGPPQDAKVLREMADLFEKKGCQAQADFLRKRAAYRELPPDKKAQHKAIFKQAMASTNPDAVETVAKAFEKQAATGNAAALRKYAEGLRTAATSAALAPAPAPSPSPAAGEEEEVAA